MSLSEAEYLRYKRQINLQGFSFEGQELLKNAKVLIVGVGGLGCPVAQYLATAGVGTIGLADDDTVDVSNLHRQILYREEDIGKLKVECAKRNLLQHNPHVSIHTYPNAITHKNLDMMNEYDLIIDGTDQFDTRYLLNAGCRKMRKPFLFGAISAWKGTAGLFFADRGPCYQCLFPEKPAVGAFQRCNEGGVLGVLPGVVGLIQASIAIRFLTDPTELPAGEIHSYDLLTMSFKKYTLPNDDECPICQGDFRTLNEVPREITPKQLKCLVQQVEGIQIIDVREIEELLDGVIENSLHLPLGDIPHQLHKVNENGPIVLYCQKGIRSKYALDFLQNHGFKNASHLKGGWIAWEKE